MQSATECELENVVFRLQHWLDETIRQMAGREGLAAVVKSRQLAQSSHADSREVLPVDSLAD
jgi:hypothetical protein